jgi:hypothetical protein
LKAVSHRLVCLSDMNTQMTPCGSVFMSIVFAAAKYFAESCLSPVLCGVEVEED